MSISARTALLGSPPFLISMFVSVSHLGYSLARFAAQNTADRPVSSLMLGSAPCSNRSPTTSQTCSESQKFRIAHIKGVLPLPVSGTILPFGSPPARSKRRRASTADAAMPPDGEYVPLVARDTGWSSSGVKSNPFGFAPPARTVTKRSGLRSERAWDQWPRTLTIHAVPSCTSSSVGRSWPYTWIATSRKIEATRIEIERM